MYITKYYEYFVVSNFSTFKNYYNNISRVSQGREW